MTRITQSDQVLLLLQNHLERAQRRKRGHVGVKNAHQQRPLARAQAIASMAGLGDSDVHRTVIAGLLAEEFGPDIASDPRFQAIVSEVHDILQKDASGLTLLQAACAQLKAGGA